MFEHITARLGLDASAWRRGLQSADKEASRFSSQLSRLGLGFFSLSAGVSFFRQILDNARQAEGELDKNTAAVKRTAEGFDMLGQAAMKAGTATIGWLGRMGEAYGRYLSAVWKGRGNIVEGYSQVRKIESEIEKGKKAIEANELRITEIQKEREQRLKDIASIEKESEKLAESQSKWRFSQLETEKQIEANSSRLMLLRRELTFLDHEASESSKDALAIKEVNLEIQHLQNEQEKLGVKFAEERRRIEEKARADLERKMSQLKSENEARKRDEDDILRSLTRQREQIESAQKTLLQARRASVQFTVAEAAAGERGTDRGQRDAREVQRLSERQRQLFDQLQSQIERGSTGSNIERTRERLQSAAQREQQLRQSIRGLLPSERDPLEMQKQTVEINKNQLETLKEMLRSIKDL